MKVKNIIRRLILIFFCIYSAFFFVGSISAPILAHFKMYDASAFLTSLYVYSCHQQPDRCFWILGYPVALCCRCLGFYIGVFVFAIVDVLDKLKINSKTYIMLSAVCAADIIINYGLGVRNNTGNITRFVVGIIMGLLFIVTLSFILKKEWRKVKYED